MGTEVITDDQTRQPVVLALGDEEFGVPITPVQEIIHRTPPRPIPGRRPGVGGAINPNGRNIPVGDLRARFGAEVKEVLSIGAEHTEAPPERPGDADYLEAVEVLEGRLLVILDLERLLAGSAI